MTQKLIAYKRMPIWTKDTMPEALQRKHNTKVGTWGKITVLKGQLRFIELTEEGEEIASHLFEAGAENPMAEPQAWHRVEAATDDVEWYLEFYCEPKDYFPKKYNTNPVHSEVLEAVGIVPAGKALDLGCGQGRNALFLAQHGFDVTAVDQNELALEILQSIVTEEDLEMPVGLYDINAAALTQNYDFIVSTVVLMFLEADRIPAIIRNMQEHTNPGATISLSVPWIRKIILAICPSRSPLKKENWRSITRIGNWSSTMKIQAISIVETRMAIGFNFDLQPCWQRKNKEKAGC